MTSSDVALVLHAVGRGRRMSGGKLNTDLDSVPLACRAATISAEITFAARIAVVTPSTPDFCDLGFEQLPLKPASAPLLRSIAVGVVAALKHAPWGLMVALADRPFIPASHDRQMIETFG